MALQFVRNAKVYVELEGNDTGGSPANNFLWELPVLNGFSFTQSMSTTEVTVNEAGSASRRARLVFNDALAPVEWSFSTYIRPFRSAGGGTLGKYQDTNVHAVEEPLWAMLLGADTFTKATGIFTNSLAAAASPAAGINAGTASTNTWNFGSSNVSAFTRRWNIYVSMQPTGGTVQTYLLSEAVATSATIDFDIEGIATIQWSGFAKQIIDQGSTSLVADRDFYEGTTDTTTFIRNRLSTVTLTRTDSPNGPYSIVLTGGSISIENNLSFLTPEELGKVNQPISSVTGPRTIKGNMTAYLDTGTNTSGDLLADLLADTSTVRNSFNLDVNIGGATASTNRVTFGLPYAHLEVPTVGVEELLTVDIAFHAQPPSGNVDAMNEMTITYKV